MKLEPRIIKRTGEIIKPTQSLFEATLLEILQMKEKEEALLADLQDLYGDVLCLELIYDNERNNE